MVTRRIRQRWPASGVAKGGVKTTTELAAAVDDVNNAQVFRDTGVCADRGMGTRLSIKEVRWHPGIA